MINKIVQVVKVGVSGTWKVCMFILDSLSTSGSEPPPEVDHQEEYNEMLRRQYIMFDHDEEDTDR